MFDFLAEAKRLIRFHTVTWESNADCAVYVGSLMRQAGLEVSYQESRSGEALFLNVVGCAGVRGAASSSGSRWGGKGWACPLLLATHLDTVSPGEPRLWTQTGGDPWRLTVRGDRLYGLGAADAKLDLLSKLVAIGRLDLSRLKRPILLLGTFGEESGLRGAARFCQGDWPRPRMALVGEPTELALVTRHKGLAVAEVIFRSRGLWRPAAAQWVYEVSFQGAASHSSTPALGRNALEACRDFLAGLSGPKAAGGLRVLSWEGGDGHNVIPAWARLRLTLGDRPKQNLPSGRGRKVRVERASPGWYPTLPWEEAAGCVETMRALFAPLQKVREKGFDPPTLTWNWTRLKEDKEGWTLTFDLRALPGQPVQRTIRRLEDKLWKRLGHPGPTWQFRLERDNPPLDNDAASPVVKEARAALRAARLPVRLAAKSGCSEAGLYHRVGIPSVVIGPGRSAGNIHRPNEAASLRQLRAAARFYEAFLRRTCF